MSRRPLREIPIASVPAAVPLRVSPTALADSMSATKRPLRTLYEAPASPHASAAGSASPGGVRGSPSAVRMTPGRGTPRSWTLDDTGSSGEELPVPPTPPRRLIDDFLASAKKPKAPSSLSSGGTGSAPVSVPASPFFTAAGDSPRHRRSASLVKEATPPQFTAFEIYQDPDETPAAETEGMVASPEASMELDDSSGVDSDGKENTAPAPRRRRSTSLLSTQAFASSDQVDQVHAFPAEQASRPELPTADTDPGPSTTSRLLASSTSTIIAPRDGPSAPAYASWYESSTTSLRFGEAENNGMGTGTLGRTSSEGLLPSAAIFGASTSSRKRPSLGEGKEEDKRPRLDDSDLSE